MIELSELNIKNIDNLIALAVFGSFQTEFWIKGKSDIDILLLLDEFKTVSFEFELEDTLIPIFQDFFDYNNIHLTFIYMNDFASPFAIQYMESKNKLVLDFAKEIDFRLYVNKYKRNNKWLEDMIKEDNESLRRWKNESLL